MTELNASIRLRLISDIDARAQAIAGRIRELEQAIEKGGAEGSAAMEQLQREFRNLAQTTREAERVERDFAKAQTALARTSGATASALGAVATAEAAVAKSSAAAAAGVGRVSQESKNRGRELGGLVNVVAEMGYSFGAAIPGMQQFGTQLAIMGGSAYQLGAAFGVGGVAVGILTGILPSLISGLTSSSDEMDSLGRNTEQAARSFDSLREAEQRRREAREAGDRLRSGRESVAETEDALRAARDQLSDAEKDITREQGAVLRRAGRELGTVARAELERAIRDGKLEDLAERLTRARVQSERAAGRVVNEQLVGAQVGAFVGGTRQGLAAIRTAAATRDAQAVRVQDLEAGLERARKRESEEQAAESRRDDEAQLGRDQASLREELERRIAGVGNRGRRTRLERAFREGTLTDSSRLLSAFGSDRGVVEDRLRALSQTEQAQRQLSAEDVSAALARADKREAQLRVQVEVSDDRVSVSARAEREDGLGVIVGQGAELGGLE